MSALDELQAVKAAFATLRALGYTYQGGNKWEPPAETVAKLQALDKEGWYQLWQMKGEKKNSSDGYALVHDAQMVHFDLWGRIRREPVPFEHRPFGYELLKRAPRFGEGL